MLIYLCKVMQTNKKNKITIFILQPPKWWQPFLRGNNNYYSTNVIPCNFYLAECTEPEKWDATARINCGEKR